LKRIIEALDDPTILLNNCGNHSLIQREADEPVDVRPQHFGQARTEVESVESVLARGTQGGIYVHSTLVLLSHYVVWVGVPLMDDRLGLSDIDDTKSIVFEDECLALFLAWRFLAWWQIGTFNGRYFNLFCGTSFGCGWAL
jgi:hypothetical protein